MKLTKMSELQCTLVKAPAGSRSCDVFVLPRHEYNQDLSLIGLFEATNAMHSQKNYKRESADNYFFIIS